MVALGQGQRVRGRLAGLHLVGEREAAVDVGADGDIAAQRSALGVGGGGGYHHIAGGVGAHKVHIKCGNVDVVYIIALRNV